MSGKIPGMRCRLPFVIRSVALGFAALAVVGIVLGRGWRLLFVPLAILPLVRLIRGGDQSEDATPGKTGKRYRVVFHDIFHTYIAVGGAWSLAFYLPGGSCAWAQGAMAAAMTAISVSFPALAIQVRYPVLRLVCAYAAATCYAFLPMIFTRDPGIAVYGSFFVVLVYIPVRFIRAVRDRKKEEAA